MPSDETLAPSVPGAPQVLLEAEHARVVHRDVTVWDDVSFELRGRRIGLLGDWSPVFRVLGCQAEVVRGRLSIGSEPADRAVSRGSVGLAQHSLGVFGKLTCFEYLADSAFLAGAARTVRVRSARDSVRKLLRDMYLEWLAPRSLGTLSALETRALLIANAAIGNPSVLALELPLADLNPEEQDWVAGLVERTASAKQGVVISVRTTNLFGAERRLLDSMDGVYRLSPTGARAWPSPVGVCRVDLDLDPRTSRYLVVVGERGSEFIEALHRVGVEAEAEAEAEASSAHGQPTRLVAALEAGGDTRLILETSVGLEIPVFELTPLQNERA